MMRKMTGNVWAVVLMLAAAPVCAAPSPSSSASPSSSSSSTSSSTSPASSSDLSTRQTEAEREQASLRERINALQKDIDAREAARKDAADALRASETAISRINLQLRDLGLAQRRAETDLTNIEKQIAAEQITLAQRRDELARQLRAEYSSGLSPWAALLSGDDPQQLGRNLGYLDFISQARARALARLRAELDRMAQLQASAASRRAELTRVASETTAQKSNLVAEQKQRAGVLARIESQLQARRVEAAKLGRDDDRLSGLIDNLQVAIARQAAEEARRAEEARKAVEQARQAEIARKAQEARQAAQAQAAQAAAAQAAAAQAASEQARRAAAANAAANAATNAAAQSREQAGRAVAANGNAAQPGAETDDGPHSQLTQSDTPRLTPPWLLRSSGSAASGSTASSMPPSASASASSSSSTPSTASTPATSSASSPPSSSQQPDSRPAAVAQTSDSDDDDDGGSTRRPHVTGTGLKHGMALPVAGGVPQGRFGLGRPDGGVWRGIVLRAPEGTPVKAVAAGAVVYADWLRGFGNIIIIDNGRQYMTVYAYNQSLLKRVGDPVSAGDTIATVGATGGQVESGLYFEIRYRGTPVDPLQWLAM